MSPAPTLLVLGGASHTAGADCLRQAAGLGLDVWLTDTAGNLAAAPELAAAATRHSAVDFHDPAACARWAGLRARDARFVGVYGFREFAVESVAAVAAALGVPGNPVSAVRLVRDKYSCRRALAASGFAQPAISCCTSRAQASEFMDRNPPGPWVIKPRAEMGSTGVSLVDGPDDLDDAVSYLAESCSAAARARGGSAAGCREFLIEQYQAGPEYSAEGIFLAGQPHVLVLTQKQTTGAPHFVETGHQMPAMLAPPLERTARETVCAALRAAGLTWGVFHVEFWVSRDSVVLGELHARPGGDYIHLMTQLVTGIELHGAVFAQLLGHRLDPAAWSPRGGAAIRFLHADTRASSAANGGARDRADGGACDRADGSELVSVTGWDEVLASADCVRAELTVRPGQLLRPATSSAGRPGLVVARGASAQDAAARAAALASSVRFQTTAGG